MINIYTMGFCKKTAEDFFNIIKKNKIDILIDVRINNNGQLAGFTKEKDLTFFLKELCNCNYFHEIQFAPTKELLQNYRNKKITWDDYEKDYLSIIKSRNCVDIFRQYYTKYENVLFLCSEEKADFCHRKILANYIGDSLNLTVKDL